MEGRSAMLGRKTYTREELDHCKAAIGEQLAAYKTLVEAVAGAATDKKVDAALASFETFFFNNLTLALDRYFVHRVRMVSGKDGNPLNEVEMIGDSLMNNNGILRESTVIKLIPDQSVVRLQFGDSIRLTAEEFERLSSAFFTEMEQRFL
jgi:hypothetical protein